MNMENKISTAEEFLALEMKKCGEEKRGIELPKILIEFAKLHVEAALNQASENSNLLLTDKKGNTKTTGGYDAYGSVATVNKQSILNAYPLEQIK